MARPTKSSRASVVGAITRAARASRKLALDAQLLTEGGPAAHLHGQLGDCDGRFAGGRFDLQGPQWGFGPARRRWP